MCTLTFLPIDKKRFIITSNRDESVLRKTELPKIKIIKEKKVLFPKDKQAGGSWFATADNGWTVCLLNGAFEKHISNPPYRKSRGLVLLDVFSFDAIKDFLNDCDLSGIEPFTMIMFDASPPNPLQSRGEKKIFITELRWDGEKKFIAHIDSAKPNIWASASLYSSSVIEKRKKWFAEWLAKNKKFTVDSIRQFHHFGGEGDIANDVKMKRGDILMTVSISSVEYDEATTKMIYEDLITKKSFIRIL